jgi:uncharacterized protein (UPF0264 family)
VHRHDAITGSSLGGGNLAYEILEIGKLRFEMLHRLRRIVAVAVGVAAIVMEGGQRRGFAASKV